jgi:hypothetical protein
MALGSMLRIFSFPVAVAVTLLGSGWAMAADQPGAAATAAGPVMTSNAACATCNSTHEAACNACRAHHSLFHHKKVCTPYQTTLCPGACFGYFQTQWHRWENVCPIPYQGVGLSDAPLKTNPPPTPPVIPKTGSDGPVPKIPMPK